MIELDKFDGHEPGLTITILKDPSTNEYLKRCEFNGEIIILKTGETTNGKSLIRLDRDFPFVIFDLSEAAKYGLNIKCEDKNEFWSYFNLTCEPRSLTLLTNVSFEEAIGCHRRTDIFSCSKCGKKWQIEEEFDTHHGYVRICKTIN